MNSNPEDVAAEIQQSPDIYGVENAVPKFFKVDIYTTFTAEWAAIDGDFVIHFFLPSDQVLPGGSDGHYWQTLFPQVLSDSAESFFSATKPRITAQYTPELSSWFFKARGFALVLNQSDFLAGFFAALDSSLDGN